MVDNSSAAKIEQVLRPKKGVVSIKVSLKDKMAVVVFEPIVTTEEDVRATIQDLGFTATLSAAAQPGTNAV